MEMSQRAPALLAYVSAWEFECCGTPWRLGDEVTTGLWRLGGEPLTGPLGSDVLTWYCGHQDDGPVRRVRARVTGLWEELRDDWRVTGEMEPFARDVSGWVCALDVVEER